MNQSISVTALAPGTVLAADVRASNGRLLLQAGTCLADKHLVILRTWGVSEVQIAGESSPTPPVPLEDEETFQQALVAITPRFLHLDLSQPAVAELLRLGALRRARKQSDKTDRQIS